MFPLLARGRDRLETDFTKVRSSPMSVPPLLARGRDRLETTMVSSEQVPLINPLLARGRDRLETIG